MAWETFDKSKPPQLSDPRVTIQKNGVMTFNTAARVALGEPMFVTLLYDRENHRVGFRKVERPDATAYNFRRQGKSTTYNVSGQSFCRHYGIELGYTRRYPAKMEDGVLAIALDDAEERIS